MIKFRIPSRFEVTGNLHAAIQSVLPGVSFTVTSNGVVTLDVPSLSPAQRTALKAAALAELTDVQDLDAL